MCFLILSIILGSTFISGYSNSDITPNVEIPLEFTNLEQRLSEVNIQLRDMGIFSEETFRESSDLTNEILLIIKDLIINTSEIYIDFHGNQKLLEALKKYNIFICETSFKRFASVAPSLANSSQYNFHGLYETSPDNPMTIAQKNAYMVFVTFVHFLSLKNINIPRIIYVSKLYKKYTSPENSYKLSQKRMKSIDMLKLKLSLFFNLHLGKNN